MDSLVYKENFMGLEKVLAGQPGSARCKAGHERKISDYRIDWSETAKLLRCPECNRETESRHEYADGRVWSS
jgi:hypothetical protein